MQSLRALLRGSLARGLQSLEKEDRLAAALPLVCGSALAARCEVATLDADGILHLRVHGQQWVDSLAPMREVVRHDLQRVAGVPLAGLHFEQPGSAAPRFSRPRFADPFGTAEDGSALAPRAEDPSRKRRN